jgi:GNAT superfamily N-acetyltransferase
MSKLRIETLDTTSRVLVEAAVTLLVNAFAKPDYYGLPRLQEEIQTLTGLFYRQFFIAQKDGKIIGVGGVKAAEWASRTHLLYLSAVAPEYRGQGIGRALLKARLDWIEDNFTAGRILVSSAKAKRFRDLGFTLIPKSGLDGRFLMIRRF